MIRRAYRAVLPHETRFRLYKLFHQEEFRRLRTEVNVHPKGNFSLRRYDERKCIFVHITKSAGTSVAASLFGELPYHHTAVEYRVIFGRRSFREYYKFAFARNPWDRLHSAFAYLKAGGWDERDAIWAREHLGRVTEFEQFVMEWMTPARLRSHIHFWPQRDFLCDRKGRLLVDYLGHFETLAIDFDRVREKVNPGATLAHVNRSPREDYRAVYSSRAVSRVAELYAADIDLLGYSFDGAPRQTPSVQFPR